MIDMDVVAQLDEQTKKLLLNALKSDVEKKRHPFAKGDGVTIWENTSQKTGEKYYNVQILGNKGVACFKPKENMGVSNE